MFVQCSLVYTQIVVAMRRQKLNKPKAGVEGELDQNLLISLNMEMSNIACEQETPRVAISGCEMKLQ